uniref:SFRICE_011374 n=1 Tax=Spodoptera frugiperda TaxID=7108 RepID=A0A2H1V1K5_SPOFR
MRKEEWSTEFIAAKPRAKAESSNIACNFCHKSWALEASLMCTYNDGSTVKINLAFAFASSAAAVAAACPVNGVASLSFLMHDSMPSKTSIFSAANAHSCC